MKGMSIKALTITLLIHAATAYGTQSTRSFFKQNFFNVCLIVALTVTSAILGYMLWKKQTFPFQLCADVSDRCQANAQTSITSTHKAADSNRIKQLEEELESQENANELSELTVTNLQQDFNLQKRSLTDTVNELNTAKRKIDSVDFVLNSHKLKNATKALNGMYTQAQRQKPHVYERMHSLLEQTERLQRDIELMMSIEELPVTSDPLISRLQVVLGIGNAKQELNQAKKTLSNQAQEIDLILSQLPQLKNSNTKRQHELHNDINLARAFINKHQSSQPHKVLGIAPDAMMPEIVKAYRALSKQYHSDKNKEKEDYDAVMKIIDNARSSMVKALNN